MMINTVETKGRGVQISPRTLVRIRNNKSVRFASVSRNDLHEIDYIPKQYANDVWYSSVECRAFKAESCQCAKNYRASMNKAGSNNKDIKYVENKTNGTIRGIEYLIDQRLNRQRQLRKENATNAVLGEQYKQNELGFATDAYSIADVYRSNGSTEAQLIAYKMALNDESIASNIAKKSKKINIKIFKRPSRRLSGILFPRKRGESCTAA